MSEQKPTRYPGAHPFSDDGLSRKLFCGREQEALALTNQILANRLVVLFARSGLGKTSLLNAGVVEKLRVEHFLPLIVRVNDKERDPLVSIYRGIEDECKRHAVEYIPGERASLWHFFKSAQFWKQDILLVPILILDQFEELFTLHSEQTRDIFLDQFSCLVRGVRPKESGSQLAQEDKSGSIYSDAAPAVKIVISLREDFLAQLEEISDRIPQILDQRFRLLPLGRRAARRALVAPAKIEDASLITKPFQIAPKARKEILDFLERRTPVSSRRSTNNIEPFQLQLICQHMEEIAQDLQRKNVQGKVTVDMAKIGGISNLLKIHSQFYKRQVAAVPSFFQRRQTRTLCSEFLINPQGRRIQMEESEIQRIVGVKPQSLQILVERRLLRRDRRIDASYYEISHDSLIAPIVDTVRWWFLVRIASLALVAATVIFAAFPFCYFLFGPFYDYWGWPGITDSFFIILSVVVLVCFLGKFVFRKICQIREMWRRFRIE